MTLVASIFWCTSGGMGGYMLLDADTIFEAKYYGHKVMKETNVDKKTIEW